MNDSSQYAVEAINAIKDKALLLAMANEYLCEEVFLMKMGGDIEKNISRLRDDIHSLKKEFPGKFATEIKTDDIIEKMENTAQSMLKPGQEIKEACLSGKLGNELESSVKSIADAVEQIRMQVIGGEVTYTKKDLVFNMFDRITGIGKSLGTTLGLAVKALFCLIIIVILTFCYLYFTMEKESTLLKNIETTREYISERQDMLTKLELEKEDVSKEIEKLKNDVLERGNKIALMDLEVEIQRINQDHHTLEAEIAAQEKKIEDYRKRIQEIKETPFMKRLLRQ